MTSSIEKIESESVDSILCQASKMIFYLDAHADKMPKLTSFATPKLLKPLIGCDKYSTKFNKSNKKKFYSLSTHTLN